MFAIKKDYLTFDELRNRWGVTNNDMHDLMRDESLIPAIFCGQRSFKDGYWVFDPHNGLYNDLNFVSHESKPWRTAGDSRNYLFLRCPIIESPKKYRFMALSVDPYDQPDDGVGEGAKNWFEWGCPTENDDLLFFNDLIEKCEQKHPELRARSSLAPNPVSSGQHNDKDQSANGAQSSDKWPWGNHETALLRKLSEAASKFWALYDPSEPSTAPTNEQVASWLVSNGTSQRTAEVMATLLRADGLATGPRK